MIIHHWHRDNSILEVAPQGPLQAADFRSLASMVDPHILDEGNLKGLMISAEQFDGWESFAALIDHLNFVRDHHRSIRRIALLSDSPVFGVLPRILDHFVSAEVRPFAQAERNDALEWLAGG